MGNATANKPKKNKKRKYGVFAITTNTFAHGIPYVQFIFQKKKASLVDSFS